MSMNHFVTNFQAKELWSSSLKIVGSWNVVTLAIFVPIYFLCTPTLREHLKPLNRSRFISYDYYFFGIISSKGAIWVFFLKKAAANNNSNKLSSCYAKYKKKLLLLLLCLKNGGPLYKWNFLVVSSFSHTCYSRTPPPLIALFFFSFSFSFWFLVAKFCHFSWWW